jgi:hypothetical protein
MPSRSASANLMPGRVAVVVQHLDTGRRQLVVEAVARGELSTVLLGGRQHRRQRLAPRPPVHRPREPEVVVVLLGDGRDRARHADPVTTHHHRMLLASLVGVHAVEGFGVLGTELEHLPDLDAPVDRERLAATRARIARDDLRDAGPDVDVEVAIEDGAADVVVGLVRAGDPRLPGAHEPVGDDQRHVGEMRADVALGQLGMLFEIVIVEQPNGAWRDGLLEQVRVDLAVAGHQREPDLAVDVEGDRLEQLAGRNPELGGDAVDAGQVGSVHLLHGGDVACRRDSSVGGCAAPPLACWLRSPRSRSARTGPLPRRPRP